MRFSKIITNKLGISLLETVIAMGMTGAIALGVSRIMNDSIKQSRHIAQKMDVNNFSNFVSVSLMNKQSCMANFVNPGLELGEQNELLMNQIVDATGSPILTVDEFIPGNDLKVKEIKMIRGDGDLTSLRVVFEKRVTKNKFGVDTFTKNYPLTVIYDGNQISGCNSNTTELVAMSEETCTALGGDWLESQGLCEIGIGQIVEQFTEIQNNITELTQNYENLQQIVNNLTNIVNNNTTTTETTPEEEEDNGPALYHCPTKPNLTASCGAGLGGGIVSHTFESECTGQVQTGDTCISYTNYGDCPESISSNPAGVVSVQMTTTGYGMVYVIQAKKVSNTCTPMYKEKIESGS